MMRNLGRIILLVVGGFLIYSAIKDFTVALDGIKNVFSGWENFIKALTDSTSRTEALAYLTTLVKSVITMIVALSAILSAIFNHGGFWFSIFSIILLAMFVWNIVTKSKAGAFSGDDKWKVILQLCIDSISQIGYIVGFLLLKFTHKK